MNARKVLASVGKLLLSIGTVCYPVLVYYSLRHIEPRAIAGILAAVVVIRGIWLFRSSDATDPQPSSLPLLAVGGMLAVLVLLTNQKLLLKLYPVFVNTSLFILFYRSLLQPPTMIERLARLTEPDLPDHAVIYTRHVTIAWCAFFLFNGSAALYTTFFASFETWTLYNGVIAYILMSAMFVVEYPCRLYVKRKHADIT